MRLDDLTLEHYTDKPFVFDQGRTYEQKEPMGMLKPVGLWVSVPGGDPDWPQWCRSEEFRVGSLAYRSVLSLRPDANVLLITSPTGLDMFHGEYSVEDETAGAWYRSRGAEQPRQFWPVDWRRVAREYQGIIVTPYLWSRRMDGPSWYYGMDCASGCIWDLDAFESSVDCPEMDTVVTPNRGRDLIYEEEN